MITVWLTIFLGALIVIFLIYGFIKSSGDEDSMAIIGVLTLIVLVAIGAIVYFKNYKERYVEADYEYHRFKDRITVVGHGMSKDYMELGDLDCFEEGRKGHLKLDYNIFGNVVEKHILNTCEMEEILLEESQKDG